MADVVVNYVHLGLAAFFQVVDLVRKLVLLKFPHAALYTTGCNSLFHALRVKELQDGKPKFYWLHSLVLTLIMGFGGGFVAPILIGKPSAPIANDVVLPFVIITWYACNYLGLVPLFNLLPIKTVWTVFVALFRTHAVCNMTKAAFEVLKAGPYYPIPAVGPVIVGTVVGSVGAFFPLDKGLAPIKNGTPWAMQGAFLSSFFYHFMVHDKEGVVGVTLRACIGTYSEETARFIIGLVQIATLLGQVFFSPEANLFTPFHKFFYLIFQVEGPSGANQAKSSSATVGWSYPTRIQFERFMEFSRFLIVILAFAFHVYLTKPAASLFPGATLPINKFIGTCQIMPKVQGCQPYSFALQNATATTGTPPTAFKFVTYKGVTKAPETVPAWELKVTPSSSSVFAKKLRSASTADDKSHIVNSVYATLDKEGVVRLVYSDSDATQEENLWTSATKCVSGDAKASNKRLLALTVDGVTGKAIVQCGDGSNLVLV